MGFAMLQRLSTHRTLTFGSGLHQKYLAWTGSLVQINRWACIRFEVWRSFSPVKYASVCLNKWVNSNYPLVQISLDSSSAGQENLEVNRRGLRRAVNLRRLTTMVMVMMMIKSRTFEWKRFDCICFLRQECSGGI